jgi:CRISPR/Cas system CSM-associated protein Csm2 small subunit
MKSKTNSPQIRSKSVQDGEGQSIDKSLGKHGQGTHKPSLTSPVDTQICICGHDKFEHTEKNQPTRCMYGNGFNCKCKEFQSRDEMNKSLSDKIKLCELYPNKMKLKSKVLDAEQVKIAVRKLKIEIAKWGNTPIEESRNLQEIVDEIFGEKLTE